MDDPVKTFNQLKSIVTPFFNLAVNTVVHGMHNVPPSGKLIIVGNHRSDMDPFVISATFPRFISWVAADYTFRIPLFKDLISKTGCIPMAIDSKVSMSSIKMIQQVFKRGEVLGIFPEGHDYMVRNDFSLGMVDFHEGFSAFSIRNKVDITPFIITPIEETVSDIPIAPILRAFMGLPEE
ncbi:MAG: 1-acyl-sn-glycerol-3-phosphate acyltransferase, partial [Leptospiraceae bacterium]|nr:1-acyl-sn-glycerol-3-phosphate acyltransferase [Leptospiraceae bacterium]